MGKRAVLLFVVLTAMVVACDEMNRPMAVPQTTPRRSCFSDVECPSSTKCVKGPNDVQGLCEARTPAEDAGAGTGTTEDAGALPVPPHAPAPGDVSL